MHRLNIQHHNNTTDNRLYVNNTRHPVINTHSLRHCPQKRSHCPRTSKHHVHLRLSTEEADHPRQTQFNTASVSCYSESHTNQQTHHLMITHSHTHASSAHAHAQPHVHTHTYVTNISRCVNVATFKVYTIVTVRVANYQYIRHSFHWMDSEVVGAVSVVDHSSLISSSESGEGFSHLQLLTWNQ